MLKTPVFSKQFVKKVNQLKMYLPYSIKRQKTSFLAQCTLIPSLRGEKGSDGLLVLQKCRCQLYQSGWTKLVFLSYCYIDLKCNGLLELIVFYSLPSILVPTTWFLNFLPTQENPLYLSCDSILRIHVSYKTYYGVE